MEDVENHEGREGRLIARVSVSLITMDVLITAAYRWQARSCAVVECNSSVTSIETRFDCIVHGGRDREERYNLILPVI